MTITQAGHTCLLPLGVEYLFNVSQVAKFHFLTCVTLPVAYLFGHSERGILVCGLMTMQNEI